MLLDEELTERIPLTPTDPFVCGVIEYGSEGTFESKSWSEQQR